MMIVITGADLYTGNTMVLIPGLLNRKAPVLHVLKTWILCYFANFVGAVAMGYFFCYLPYNGDESASGWIQTLNALALKKVKNTIGQQFLLSIAANWLVCLAVFLAYAADDIPGKIMGIFVPIMVFNKKNCLIYINL